MKSSVTAFINEGVIIVDGRHVVMEDGISPAEDHEDAFAVYWNGASGSIERIGNIERDGDTFNEEGYDVNIAPYVQQWEEEVERLEEIEARRIAAEAAEAERIASDIDHIEMLAKAERNLRLQKSDYLMMPDYPLDESLRPAVIAYRQALRDLPQQEGWPESIQWPEPPFEIEYLS